MLRDPLFLNHFAFMHRHRGRVVEDQHGVHAIGPIPSLMSWTPECAASALPGNCRAVRLAPWSGAAWPERLPAAGFEPAEAYSYMVLDDLNRPIGGAADAIVRRATTEAEVIAFAEIQSAGFLSGASEEDQWWRRYFQENALANLRDPDQDFLLAYAGGEPVTCTLALRAAGVTGVYAVATRPARRRRGYSGAALERVRQDVCAAIGDRIALQAVAGSYAEGYYARLGFSTAYTSQVWRKAAASPDA